MFELAVWLIPLAPFAATILALILRRLGQPQFAHYPVLAGLGLSAVLAIGLTLTGSVGDEARVVAGYRFLDIGGLTLDVSLRVDALTQLMLCVVTGISFLVCSYSVGYMRHDPGYARYFAIFAAFVGSMAMLVLAGNLVLLYAFWEGVGVCSYLLIGFWFQKPSASKAALKAFLVNRVGDCGFLLGIILLWWLVGQTPVGAAAGGLGRLDFAVLFDAGGSIIQQSPDLLLIAGLLMLVGAIGKSAQFPLHVWLPDAMEGPTPVSALIHAATMVTAGVYLLARLSPVLVYVPEVYEYAGWLGGITALLGAVIAIFQTDLKRVLAYSTVSQLGYMFLALSAGAVEDLMTAAVIAAIFHLFTHAFFKALLFLAAGNVMHAMGDVIDMRRFSGLDKVLPKTSLAFAVGAAALAGLPPLSGFWSKEEVLGVLVQGSHDVEFSNTATWLVVIGLTASFLTALYSSRAYFLTFWGPKKLPDEAGHHPHEAEGGMLISLGVLAVGALVAGIVFGPTGIFARFLVQTPGLKEMEGHHAAMWLPIVSGALAFGGVIVGWLSTRGRTEYMPVKKDTAMGGLFAPIVALGRNKFFLDEIYRGVIVLPLEQFARLLSWFDKTVIDGLAMQLSSVPSFFGAGVRRLQTGQIGNYLWFAIGGVFVLLIWISTR